jgi:hypothetical protein
VFFVAIRRRGAGAFGEFGQSQPHRRHFSEHRFVLRGIRKLGQPQAVGSVLPILRTRGHLDPSHSHIERSEG